MSSPSAPHAGSSYCPDFSDMVDDDMVFWDFLSYPGDPDNSVNKVSAADSSIKDKNNLANIREQTIPCTNLDEVLGTSRDPRTSTEHSVRSSYNCDGGDSYHVTAKRDLDANQSYLLSTSSEDTFWDFLHSNSPVIGLDDCISKLKLLNYPSYSESSSCEETEDTHLEKIIHESTGSSTTPMSNCCKRASKTEYLLDELLKSCTFLQSDNEESKLDSEVREPFSLGSSTIEKQLDREKNSSTICDSENLSAESFFQRKPSVENHIYKSKISSSNANSSLNDSIARKEVSTIRNDLRLTAKTSANAPSPLSLKSNFVCSEKHHQTSELEFCRNGLHDNSKVTSRPPKKMLKRSYKNIFLRKRVRDLESNSAPKAISQTPREMNSHEARKQAPAPNSSTVCEEKGSRQILGRHLNAVAPAADDEKKCQSLPTNNVVTQVQPLYLVLPAANQEVLQDPKYSHYFLILNNSSAPLQTINQNINSHSALRNPVLVENPTQSTKLLEFQPNRNIKVSEKRVISSSSAVTSSQVGFDLPMNKPNSRDPLQTKSNGVLCDKVQFQSVPQAQSLPSCSTNINIRNIILQNTSETANKSSMENHKSVSDSNQSQVSKPSHTSQPRTPRSGSAHQQRSSTPSSAKEPLKTISLGREKNAIMQTSVPVKLGTDVLCPGYHYQSINPVLAGKTFTKLPPNASCISFHTEVGGKILKPPVVNKTIIQQDLTTLRKLEGNENKIVPFSNLTSSDSSNQQKPITIESSTKTCKLADFARLSESSVITNQSVVSFVNATPINSAGAIEINVAPARTDVPVMNSRNDTECLLTVSEVSSVRVAPIRPAVTVIPVKVLPTQTKSTPNVSKVVILNPSEVQSQRSTSSKKTKFEKRGNVTVRQLLDEQRRCKRWNSGNLTRTKSEKIALKPMLKLPIAYPSSAPGTVAGPDLIKRPHILILPSASKSFKKNVIKCDPLKLLTDRPMYGTQNKLPASSNPSKDCNPRYYDMSQLIIGSFKIDDDFDYCGPFRSKFKVIFNKRHFLYDFPASGPPGGERRMVRVVVPFTTVVSMSLAERTIRIGVSCPPAALARTARDDDAPDEESPLMINLRRCLLHKITLRNRQARKLRTLLCEFDERFASLTRLEQDAGTSEGDYSPTPCDGGHPLERKGPKNKRTEMRRLAHWDSLRRTDPPEAAESLQLNRMCSCRISCRSVRCSCVKIAQSCTAICSCVNCDNPLNILEGIGLNIEFSLKDTCLFQNVYQIPRLAQFLSKETRLACCQSVARVRECIPGVLLCPNAECDVRIEFSWCRAVVCLPDRNPRNHCAHCGECRFASKSHCFNCRKCYTFSSRSDACPTCRTRPTPTEDAPRTVEDVSRKAEEPSNPEIIVLDTYTIPESEWSPELPNERPPPRPDASSIRIDDLIVEMDITEEEPVKEDPVSLVAINKI